MCRPHRRFAPLLPRTLRHIPQAVSTVATPNRGGWHVYLYGDFNTVNGKYCCNGINIGDANKGRIQEFQYRKR